MAFTWEVAKAWKRRKLSAFWDYMSVTVKIYELRGEICSEKNTYLLREVIQLLVHSRNGKLLSTCNFKGVFIWVTEIESETKLCKDILLISIPNVDH